MDTLERRFRLKVAPANEAGCCLWTGARTKDGYGSIAAGLRGHSRLATHVALELSGRPRPSPDHHALHTCDTPSCVSNDHLWWGTHAENMADMKAKGRGDYTGFRKSWSRTSEERRWSHCAKGHELTGANLYVSPKGRRFCAVCQKARKKDRQPRLFAEPKPAPKQEALL